MGVAEVKEYLKQWGKDSQVKELTTSSATVPLAAAALGVEEARIAKSLAFKNKDACILVVAAGDARIDNRKFKAALGVAPKMMKPEETLLATGHAPGGVCPFAISNPAVSIYLDVSMRRFASIFPAAGSGSSAIELTMDELFTCSRALGWVDVTSVPLDRDS